MKAIKNQQRTAGFRFNHMRYGISGVEDLELFSGGALGCQLSSHGIDPRVPQPLGQIDVMGNESPIDILKNGEIYSKKCPHLHLKRYVFPLLRTWDGMSTLWILTEGCRAQRHNSVQSWLHWKKLTAGRNGGGGRFLNQLLPLFIYKKSYSIDMYSL